MLSNQVATMNDYQTLVALWERSVRATHTFLSYPDLKTMERSLPFYLPKIKVVMWFDHYQLIGFTGQDGTELEMFFLDPNYLHRGFGTEIIQRLIRLENIKTLDVNEQNRAARQFYRKNGFVIYGRSEVDGQGRAYPILHLTHDLPEVLKLREHPEMFEKAVAWFSSKWGIPRAAYEESMQEILAAKDSVPEWYFMLNNVGEIIAGAGVITNDFHDRPDLTPNVCAVYVEKTYRGQHFAKMLLAEIARDMATQGIEKLYLVTDHTIFYEKMGWHFLTMVHDSLGTPERLYVRNLNGDAN